MEPGEIMRYTPFQAQLSDFAYWRHYKSRFRSKNGCRVFTKATYQTTRQDWEDVFGKITCSRKFSIWEMFGTTCYVNYLYLRYRWEGQIHKSQPLVIFSAQLVLSNLY
jgi:hypothetical protein